VNLYCITQEGDAVLWVIYILYGRVQNVVTIGPDLVPIPFQVLLAQILSLYPSRFYMPRSCPYTLPGFTCPDLAEGYRDKIGACKTWKGIETRSGHVKPGRV
jgi:hypothetical protein